MKKAIQYKNALTLLLLCGMTCVYTSCKKNFDIINDDPNNPKDVPNSYYLAGAQRGIMDNTIDIWWGGQVGNQLAQYWSSNQYTSESRYQFRPSVTNDAWRSFYAGGLNDPLVNVGGLIELKRIIDNCKADPDATSQYGFPANQIAVATILRVWLFQNMTDAWGDIPYSEALDSEKSRAPKYDRQSEIYTGLISEISDAINSINTAESGPSGDLIYNGNMENWKKFANAIKMRLAIRLADRDDNAAKTAFNEAVTSGTFTSNDDNAMLPYGLGTSYNPVFYNYEIDGRNDYAASNILLAILDSNSALGHPIADPRLPAFYAPAEADGSWTPEVYGLSDANAASTPNESVAQRSSLVLSSDLPGIFMDYAQVEFMMAEAAERAWGVIDPKLHYDRGVTASIKFWTTLNGAPASDPDIEDFLLQDSVDYNKQITIASLATDKWKYPIGKQKWIALYNQGIQGWTEWRRLDFGVLQIPADGVLDGTGIPLRMKYAIDEQTLNSGNYSAAISNQGPDLQATKVWWDIK